MKQKGDKKDKMPFKRIVSNNLFALKTIYAASRSYIFIFLASSILYGLIDFLTGSYLLRRVVDGISNGEQAGSVIAYVVTVTVFSLLIQLAYSWYWNVISPVQQHKIEAYVEKKLFRKAAQVELACYEDPSFYDRYIRAMNESYRRMNQTMQALYQLIWSLFTLSANSFLLFLIDPWLILFALIPFALGIFRRLEYVAAYQLGVEVDKVVRRKYYVCRTFYLNEYAKEMRVGGMYEAMLRDLKSTYKDYLKIMRKYGLQRAILAYIQRIGLEVITILGASFYSVWSAVFIGAENGGMSIGDCIVVLGSIGTVSYCLNGLVQNLAQFGEHALHLQDIRYFLDYENKIPAGHLEAPAGGDIAFQDISFRYAGSERYAVKNVSFQLRKGERIALVGSNGSGKTTLVKLLLRLYDPESGQITLNSKNIKEFTHSSYRARFSTVFQDFKLFSMTVRDNVLLRPERDGDEALVQTALEESGAAERVSRLPKGINTMLTREFDDQGANLSVGEQQKLSLAHVFAEDTPFVILDEPSSALDPIAEYKMFENMMRATENRSVIFISHRLSSARLADRVLLMERGEITESGTHAELMAKNGNYAAMFRRQAENYLGSEVAEHA